MSQMHLIMNGWRGYLLHEHKNQMLFEDTGYITRVLGISLPLTEAGFPAPLTEDLKKEILHEQLILESFWADAVQKVKDAAGAVAGKFIDAAEGIKKFGKQGWQIIKQLYRVSTNPDLIPNFTGAIQKLNLNRLWIRGIRPVLEDLVAKLPEWEMPTLAAGAKKVLDTITQIVESVKALSGWKQAIATGGLAIGFTWIWEKVASFVEAYSDWKEKLESNDEGVIEQFKVWLKGALNGNFLNILKTQFTNIIKKLVSVATGVKAWWDTAAAAVGGANLVIKALGGPLSRFARYTGEGPKLNLGE